MRTRAALSILVALWLIALATSTARADEGWTITSFHSDIQIAADSALTITETINVDFGSLEKHGLVRTIPLRYRHDDSHDRYYELSVGSVTDGARPIPYTTSIESDNEVIKIGDPNVLVRGANRYVIKYRVVGAMNSFSDHDELFWNVDGALWPVPKATVTATVHVPAETLQKSDCFQGPEGSTEPCQHVDAGNQAEFSSTRELASGEEMSVVVGLSKGAVSIPGPMLEQRQRVFPLDAFDITPVTISIFLRVNAMDDGLVPCHGRMEGRL